MQTTFRKQTITPFQREARGDLFLANLYRWDGKRDTASLGTQDQSEAKEICAALERFFNDPANAGRDMNDKALETMLPAAKRIAFKLKETPADVPPIKRYQDSGGAFGKRYLKPLEHDEKAEEAERKRIELQRQIDQLLREKASWEKERMEYQRRLNLHSGGRIKIADALEDFAAYYVEGHAKHTAKQVIRISRQLVATMKEGAAVGDLDGNHIDDFVAAYRDQKTGGKVEQSTKLRVYRYLSVFSKWLTKKYKLNLNPFVHTQSVAAGAAKDIEAIRDYNDFAAYLDALKPFPYWRAWAAVAMLAGPRWSEQANMKLKDIAGGYIRIFATKTGRARNVPIEQTMLRGILDDYLKNVRPKWMEDHLIPDENEYLFPSLAYGHGSNGLGIWTSETFLKHWRGGWNPNKMKGGKLLKKGTRLVGVREQAITAKKLKDYAKFGPAEWRHCGATAMGHSGVDMGRVSFWIGNSEAICRRHYNAPGGAFIWPLKYTDAVAVQTKK
jgi:hypothetical protein